MDRIHRIACGLARELLAGSKWEPPRGERKTWRRRKDEGGYEYRDTPPAEVTKKGPEKVVVDKPSPFRPEMVTKFAENIVTYKRGEDFKKVLSDIKQKHYYGAAVDVYDEYPSDYKLFGNEAGDATVVVKPDGDIVSVVKAEDSKERGWATKAVAMAVQQGGDRLDCFDTTLPGAYAKAGMRAVARIPWNDEHKPEGWEYEKFNDFNKGRPDVVFMVRDEGTTEYKPGDGILVDSYEAGKLAQEEFLKGLSKKREGAMKKKKANEKLQLPVKDHNLSKAQEAELNEILVKEAMENFGLSRERAQHHVDMW